MRARRLPARLLATIIATAVIVCGVFAALAYRDFFADPAQAAEQYLKTYQSTIAPTPDPGSTVAATPGPEAGPGIGLKRAAIALGEFKKGVVESKRNCNCGPEIDKYTAGRHLQWCSLFASWVTREAGSPVSDGTRGPDSWGIVNSQELMHYLQGHGTWYSKAEILAQHLQPQPGDFVVYSRGLRDAKLGHVDVVISPQADGRATLVGGNLDNRVLLRADFDYQHSYGFLGFGRPEAE